MATEVSDQSWRGTEERPARRAGSVSFLGYFLILPTLLLIATVVVYPLLQAGVLSTTDLSFINPNPESIGLKNYVTILRSPSFWLVLRNTLIWTALVVAFQFVLGLATALLLNQPFRGRTLARGLIIIPWVTPGVIAALLWRLMYEPTLGIINGVLVTIGVMQTPIAWLAQGSTALLAVILSAIWKGTPFSTVMYLAALQSVSEDLIDAAKIDGASSAARLRYVVIPEIMPVIRVTLLLTTVWTANYFDLIYIMTAGGPVNQSHIFPTYIYELGFARAKTGMAAAFGLLTGALLLLFSLLYVRELNKRNALD